MERHLRVLFIEDDPADIELAARLLEHHGIGVDWRAADSEIDVRNILEKFRPDLVLCDYTIPGYSGRAAFNLVHALHPNLPFIFVSGTIGEEVAINCLLEGATDYVLKTNLKRLPAAACRAVDEAREKQRACEAEEARLRLAEILEVTTDFVVIMDSRHRITFINEAGCRLLGGKREVWIGSDAGSMFTPMARETVYREALPQALRTGSWVGETTLSGKTGDVALSQVVIAHRGDDGGARFFSAIGRDIRERKTYEQRIHYLAHFDGLTGLPNDSLFGDRAAQAITLVRRSGRTLALVTMNLDGFRLLAESVGRSATDRVLVDVGAQLRDGVRDCDTVARLGPDEFGVLLTELARPDDAVSIVKNLLDALLTKRSVCQQEIQISATAGIAVFPSDGDDFESLLRHATTAMHQAKRTERGGFRYHSANMTLYARERLQLETGLRCALGRDELALEYQPLIDLTSGQPCGVEALMRWNRPDGQCVPPTQFIPIAEETGLISGLGGWALEQACKTMQSWRGARGAELTLGVNVSARQLTVDYFDVVAAVLHRTGFPALRLELEITESSVMDNVACALETLTRLRQLGVRIAIDDFGTGYSSLAYLSRLPIDRLKIDRSFVATIATGKQDVTIVQAIISLGKSLGLDVLAEGVETEAQLSILKQLGCDQAQGFLFSRPLRACDLHSVLWPMQGVAARRKGWEVRQHEHGTFNSTSA
jgi:diguanylate cyclase (GGDEF)-like protein/PAS domain S-box-containing protein